VIGDSGSINSSWYIINDTQAIWSNVSINISSAVNITELRVYFTNQTANSWSDIFVDNIVAINNSYNYNLLTMKAGMNDNYTNATTISNTGYTDVGNYAANQSRLVWLWFDFNTVTRGIVFDIYYLAVRNE